MERRDGGQNGKLGRGGEGKWAGQSWGPPEVRRVVASVVRSVFYLIFFNQRQTITALDRIIWIVRDG
eukprot:scaffold22678_cov119-Isochrysis_galbana.AAC.2